MANWTESAKVVLEARYLIRDKRGELLETPDEMLQRVARHISTAEPNGKARKLWYTKFLSIMDSLEFLPNSPCLINAERELGNYQHVLYCQLPIVLNVFSKWLSNLP